MFVQKLENETSLTLEEMEMTTGGIGCMEAVWLLYTMMHSDNPRYAAQGRAMWDYYIEGPGDLYCDPLN